VVQVHSSTGEFVDDPQLEFEAEFQNFHALVDIDQSVVVYQAWMMEVGLVEEDPTDLYWGHDCYCYYCSCYYC